MDLKPGEFYIGRAGEPEEPFTYDSDTLTTHGVIVGMTGSGKTGLGVNFLEEALINGIPTLILDPKGDMGNLLLNFPDHDPADFEPWVDEAKASRKGVTPTELASVTAAKRQTQLLEHGIDAERMRRLRDGSEITIYTPGSTAGVGLNVIGSLAAPSLDWETESELILDEIEALVSSLLVLADIDSDPVSGAEHILLSAIIETHWRSGKDLDLARLIGQIPKPPFRKLGVFDIDTFFPEKDRMSLALRLNGLLASSSFSSWLQGEPLDVEALIGEGDKTKCAVVYLAHLTEAERQFVVTLILSKLVTWIRAQPGSSELKALVYLDEAFGYAPPTREPPSKKPIMTILKQARAFGVGLLLVTQNPVDLDYKAMSNAGTWIIGRLQTENDKRRILEGMQTVDRAGTTADLDALISNLEKRQFILHVVKKKKPKVFKRRRSISYRIGPLTRSQVESLMDGRKTETPSPSVAAAGTSDEGEGVPVAPAVAEGVDVVYLDPGAPWAPEVGADPTGTKMEPAAVATVQLLYDDTKAGVNHTETYEGVVFPLDGVIDPSDVVAVDHDARDFVSEAPEGASYPTLDVKLQNKTFWTGLSSDLKNHLVAQRKVEVFHNPDLGLYSRVGETEEAFMSRCSAAAEAKADEAMAKLADRYKTRIDRVKGQLSSADARVRELEGDASAKKQEELMSGAGDLLTTLLGGRSSSNPLGKAATRRAATKKAEARAEAAEQRLADKQAELEDLELDLADELAGIADEHERMAGFVSTVEIGLEKTDIRVADLKLVWVPVG